MSLLRPALVLGAAALLLPSASPGTGEAKIRWRPLVKVSGAFDVVGPRSDGRLLISTTRGLFLYRRGGEATPFARSPGGYVPPPEEGSAEFPLTLDLRVPL